MSRKPRQPGELLIATWRCYAYATCRMALKWPTSAMVAAAAVLVPMDTPVLLVSYKEAINSMGMHTTIYSFLYGEKVLWVVHVESTRHPFKVSNKV